MTSKKELGRRFNEILEEKVIGNCSSRFMDDAGAWCRSQYMQETCPYCLDNVQLDDDYKGCGFLDIYRTD